MNSEIEVFWTNTGDGPLAADLSELPAEWQSHILRAVRPETRGERAAAALLLFRVLRARGEGAEVFLRADGKPCHPAVHFNLSHSAGGVALALSKAGEVGCDTERLRPIPAHAERALSPAERRSLDGAADRTLAFFRLWTRKESYLKLTGEGLRGLSKAEITPEGRVLREGKLQRCRFFEYRVEDFLITVCAEEGNFAEDVKKFSL